METLGVRVAAEGDDAKVSDSESAYQRVIPPLFISHCVENRENDKDPEKILGEVARMHHVLVLLAGVHHGRERQDEHHRRHHRAGGVFRPFRGAGLAFTFCDLIAHAQLPIAFNLRHYSTADKYDDSQQHPDREEDSLPEPYDLGGIEQQCGEEGQYRDGAQHRPEEEEAERGKCRDEYCDDRIPPASQEVICTFKEQDAAEHHLSLFRVEAAVYDEVRHEQTEDGGQAARAIPESAARKLIDHDAGQGAEQRLHKPCGDQTGAEHLIQCRQIQWIADIRHAFFPAPKFPGYAPVVCGEPFRHTMIPDGIGRAPFKRLPRVGNIEIIGEDNPGGPYHKSRPEQPFHKKPRRDSLPRRRQTI